MARTDDQSATRTPKLLIQATVAIFVLRLVTVAVSAHAQPPAIAGIPWQDAAAIKVFPPAAQDKLVIYQFYAQWSDPCKRMEATSLRNQQIREMVQGSFLPVRVLDVSREKGKNPQYVADLEKRYRVFALPTLVVVGRDGEPLGSLIGDCSSLTTYRFLSRAMHNRS